MKKDDWIKILVPVIITWTVLLVVGYMVTFDPIYLVAGPVILTAVLFICIKYFSEPDIDRVIEMLRDFINPLISDLERKIYGIDNSLCDERFALRESLLEPNYKYAHTDILGNKNHKWIKKKVKEYNELANTINDTVTKFKEAIRESIEQRYSKEIIKYSERDVKSLIIYIADNDKAPVGNKQGIYGFWEKNRNELLALRDDGILREHINEIMQLLNDAKRIATGLMARLAELNGWHMKKSGIAEEKIEKKEEVVGGGGW